MKVGGHMIHVKRNSVKVYYPETRKLAVLFWLSMYLDENFDITKRVLWAKSERSFEMKVDCPLFGPLGDQIRLCEDKVRYENSL